MESKIAGRVAGILNFLVTALVCFMLIGCSNSDSEPSKTISESSRPEVTKTNKTKLHREEPKVDPRNPWRARIDELVTIVEAESFDVDDCSEKIQALRIELDELESATDEDRAKLTQVSQLVDAKRSQLTAAERQAKLATVPELLGNGELDEAYAALDFVLSRLPDDEQRSVALEYKQEIERRRGAQRRLKTWMKLLGSDQRSDVRAAQNELDNDIDVALPLLIEAAKDTGNPTLVANALELMRRIKRPGAAIPAMVGVLSRTEQQQAWPAAVRELQRMKERGAGPLLLGLIEASDHTEQRVATLEAFSEIVDPPQDTVLRLIPIIFGDGPELTSALNAVNHALLVHQQFNFVSLTGLEVAKFPEQAKLLQQLPTRLSELIQSDPDATSGSTGHAARLVAITIRTLPLEAISDLKVLNASGEYPDSPPQAVLDGIWNSTDLKTVWYHPVETPSSIVIDLGRERTVLGVKIWNFNQPSGTTRGWKEAEVYVSKTPTALSPVAVGIVPMAPGAADTPDYSTTISVPAVQGRYLKLKARSLWSPNSYTGLSEIQVLGF